MGIVLARIDQRLVHGIVVTQWFSDVKAQRIMVIDNKISNNELEKNAMRMSKPAGSGMSIIDETTAITNFKNGKYDNHNVLLVVNNIDVLITLMDEKIKIPEINIGIMLKNEERQKYSKHVFATELEMEKLQKLSDAGIPVYYQYTPSSKKTTLNDLKKLGGN